MTIFLIFICALLIVSALVLWGLGMVALRLTPILVNLQRRKYSYLKLERQINEALFSARTAGTRVDGLQARIQKFEEDAINEVLARRR